MISNSNFCMPLVHSGCLLLPSVEVRWLGPIPCFRALSSEFIAYPKALRTHILRLLGLKTILHARLLGDFEP